MALMNRKISEEVETLFLMPNHHYSFLSSRLVKEVAMLGGEVTELVPPLAARMLKERASQLASSGRRTP
jgi:pantetheine-phosphate adenylyltransferase